jgi:hypothetical protein
MKNQIAFKRDLYIQAESCHDRAVPPAEQQASATEVALVGAYARLPDFDSGDEPIWEAVFKWKAANPGSDASKKAMAVEGAIIKSLRDFADRTHALRMEQAAPKAAQGEPFQHRVQPWLLQCFGAEIAADTVERNHRFLEEALELVQSTGCTQSEAHQLVDYAFGRPVGEPVQEVGGVMVTLAALCLASGLDMHNAGEIELARIWTKVEAIRAKQAEKPKHSPLPQAAPQQEAQEPAAYIHVPHHTVEGQVRPVVSFEKYQQDYADGIYSTRIPLYTAPQPAPAPLSDDVVRDAAFDAVRKKLCALPRFSFLSDGYGVRRVPDKSGSWIAFDAAHALFDPVAVDAALAAQGGKV